MPSGKIGENGYGSVTPELVRELEGIFTADGVISDNDRALARYGKDQVADPRYAHPADVVVKPTKPEQIQQLMILATNKRIPVTPRGAGSGLSGGAVPIHGGIVVSFEEMNRILEIDKKSMIAIVEPGVVTNRLDDELKLEGLFFAGYPLSEEFCFVGGNVAENAGGGRAVKYGVTSRYVTGLEIVTPAGELLQIGGKRFKDVTGLDLLRLLTGSEGTLALFTKIFLRLLPRPGARAISRISFIDEIDALDIVPKIVSDPIIAPSAIEFIDQVCLEETHSLLNSKSSGIESAIIFVEIDGADNSNFSDRIDRLDHLVRTRGSAVRTIERAEDEASMAALWQIRKQVPWALKKMNPALTAEDIVVPIGESSTLLRVIRGLSVRFGVLIPFFGHAGDGNFHASPMKPDGVSEDDWRDLLHDLLSALYAETAALGGTISGEHGIGHKRIRYMPLVVDPVERALLARIKTAFDPAGILNPGKLYG